MAVTGSALGSELQTAVTVLAVTESELGAELHTEVTVLAVAESVAGLEVSVSVTHCKLSDSVSGVVVLLLVLVLADPSPEAVLPLAEINEEMCAARVNYLLPVAR